MVLQLNIDPPNLFGIDLLAPLKSFFNWLVSSLMSFASNVASALNTYIVQPILNALKWVWEQITNLIKSAIQGIINFFKSLAPVSPEKAFENIIPLLMLSVAGSIGIGSLLTALSVKIAGCGFDMSIIARFFERIFRPELFTGIVIGAIATACFRKPLGYWANYIFRPNLPDYRMAYSMFVKGIITEETLNYVLRYQGGFSEEWIKAIKKELTYTPSPFEVMRLADYVSLTPIWVSKKLSDVGMEEYDKSVYLEAILKRPLREEVRALAYEIGSQFIYGWMTEAECRRNLEKIGLKKEEIELIMPRLIWVRKRNLLNERIDIFRQQFRKDLITKEELYTKLRNLGLSEENTNLIVAYECALKGILVG